MGCKHINFSPKTSLPNTGDTSSQIQIYSEPETSGFKNGTNVSWIFSEASAANFNFQIFAFEKNKRLVSIAIIQQI